MNPRLEIKFDNDNTGNFSGYGSVFGNIDSKGDIVARGAFTKTINDAKSGAKPWPLMLLMHDMVGLPLGVWTDMREDSYGLKMEGKLALNTKRGAEAYALLTMQPRPALNGLSIGYTPKQTKIHNETTRTLKAVDIHECSIVTFPANPAARITGVKSVSGIQYSAGISLSEYPTNYDDDELDTIRGIAVKYMELFYTGEKWCVLMPGSLSKSVKSDPVRFLLEHSDFREIASTKDALRLYENDEAVFYSCRLPLNVCAKYARQEVKDNKFTAASVGIEYRQSQIERKLVSNTIVNFIHEATIKEVSLVKAGACDSAFAMLVKGNNQRTLMNDSMMLLSDSAFVRWQRAAREARDIFAASETQ